MYQFLIKITRKFLVSAIQNKLIALTCVIVTSDHLEHRSAKGRRLGHRDVVGVLRKLWRAVVDVLDANAGDDLGVHARDAVGRPDGQLVLATVLKVELVHHVDGTCKQTQDVKRVTSEPRGRADSAMYISHAYKRRRLFTPTTVFI
jgi:hypothetical protein